MAPAKTVKLQSEIKSLMIPPEHFILEKTESAILKLTPIIILKI